MTTQNSEETGKSIDLIIAHAEQAAIDDKGMFAGMDNNLMNRQTIFNEVSQLINSEVVQVLDRLSSTLDDAPSIEVKNGTFIHWNEIDGAIEAEKSRYGKE